MDWLDDRAAFAASQERSLATGRAWTQAVGERVAAAFADAAPDDLDTSAAAAERLLGDDLWLRELLAPLMVELREDARFVPPFRVHRDALRVGAVLHDGAHGSLSASVLSADALATLPPPATVVATGRMSVVRYCCAGDATLRVW